MSEEINTTIKVVGSVEQVDQFYNQIKHKLLEYNRMTQVKFNKLPDDYKIFFCSPDLFNIGGEFRSDYDFRKNYKIIEYGRIAILEFVEFETRKRSFPEKWFTDITRDLYDIVVEVKMVGDCTGAWTMKLWGREVIESDYNSIVLSLAPENILQYF